MHMTYCSFRQKPPCVSGLYQRPWWLCLQAPKEAPYHGLRWVAAKGKWEVGIEVQGSFKLVGLYTDAKEGATAHDAAVLVAGTDTPLNFPDEVSAA